MQTRIVPIAIAILLSASCSDSSPPPPPPSKTVFDEQLKALEKAKAVQQTVDQQKAEMDKKMQAAEGAAADPEAKKE